MKKIKFRAWDTEREVMANVSHIGLNDCEVGMEDEECRCWNTPYPYVCKLMQYTGLKDKNGKEIYEGDILSYKHITYTDCSKTKIEEIEDESFIEIITYSPMASIVKPHSKNVKCFGYDSINKECLILDLTSDEVEVIGNKFENPELLG